MHARGGLELLEDLLEVGIAPPRGAHRAHALLPDVREPLCVDREADDLRPVDLEQMRSAARCPSRSGRSPPCGRGSRGRSRAVSSTSATPRRGRCRPRRGRSPDAVVVADGELHRLDPLEVRLVEGRPRARLHPRGHTGDPGDRVDRMPEEVAVVHPGAPAELRAWTRGSPARPACRPHRRPSPGALLPRARDPRPTRRADAAPPRTARSGNCASRASTSRAAVSPVESERTWSSTGTWSVTAGRLPGSVVAPMAAERHDGQDRLARPAPGIRVPVVGDLRGPGLVVRLRALRRPAQGQRQGALARGDGARAGGHRRARLRDHPQPAGLGGVGHVGGFTDPLVDCRTCKKRFRADQLAESRVRPQAEQAPRRDARLRPHRAAAVQPDVQTPVGAVEERGSTSISGPRPRRASSSTSRTSPSSRGASRRSASRRSARRSATRSRRGTSSSGHSSSR